MRGLVPRVGVANCTRSARSGHLGALAFGERRWPPRGQVESAVRLTEAAHRAPHVHVEHHAAALGQVLPAGGRQRVHDAVDSAPRLQEAGADRCVDQPRARVLA